MRIREGERRRQSKESGDGESERHGARVRGRDRKRERQEERETGRERDRKRERKRVRGLQPCRTLIHHYRSTSGSLVSTFPPSSPPSLPYIPSLFFLHVLSLSAPSPPLSLRPQTSNNIFCNGRRHCFGIFTNSNNPYLARRGWGIERPPCSN